MRKIRTEPGFELEEENGEFVLVDYMPYLSSMHEIGLPEDLIDKETGAVTKLTKIGKECFCEVPGLYKITIPKTVRYIDSYAFRSCQELKIVEILNPETKFGDDAFFNCPRLTKINFFVWEYINSALQLHNIINKKIQKWDTLSQDEQNKIIIFISKRPLVQHYSLFTNNVKFVSAMLKENNKLSLASYERYIKFAIDCELIEVTALLIQYRRQNYAQEEIDAYYKDIEMIEIGLKLPTLERFKDDWCVKEVEGKFYITGYLGSDEDAIIPKATEDGYTFYGLDCDQENCNFINIENLTIDAPIEIICEVAFANAVELCSLKLPSSLKEIGDFAFDFCKNLEHVEFGECVTTIKSYAFANCGSLRKFVMPNSVKNFGVGVFSNCQKLKEVTLSNNLTVIPSSSFSCCYGLTKITIPKSVKKIEENAFVCCENLTSVVLNGEVEIDENAFRRCDNVVIYKS